MFLSLFPYFSLPTGLMPVSFSSFSCFVLATDSCLFLFTTYVVLAAFLTLHHIIQKSCRFLFFVFVFFGLMSVSSSSSSCCFARTAVICSSSFSTYIVFLHHILQNSCRLYCLFSSYSGVFFFFSGLACFVGYSLP